jgi:hypothetical protein
VITLNNIGLVEYAKKALQEKWGYVWGTYGKILTESLYSQKLKQYPTIGNYNTFIKTHWIGRKTADCVGLIKSYYWSQNGEIKYIAATDVSADGMFSRAKEKGTIASMPDIVGLCVWKKGHIGIYIGNGQVIESHGTKYGVIQTTLKGVGATAWTHWLKCPYIEYIVNVPNVSENIEEKIGEVLDNMQIKDLQHVCNVLGVKDKNGNALAEDNKEGALTKSAKTKLKEILTYIMK